MGIDHCGEKWVGKTYNWIDTAQVQLVYYELYKASNSEMCLVRRPMSEELRTLTHEHWEMLCGLFK